ncbi:MAG: lysylphosphatidylglycerol synthase transmembrane domain-containing protein [Rhodospirillaceae bacterium]|nr:lysylphosphatidylglycerol synthase transmembrane domain-containing protein [Rhodospirillaceae bacterium]
MDSRSSPHGAAMGLAAPPSAGRPGFIVLKILISAGLLAYLGARIDWTALAARLRDAALADLSLACLVLFAAVPLTALRWHLLARTAAAAMPLPTSLKLTYTGLFFGQVLPATVGGDAVRAWLAARTGLPLKKVLAGILSDRVAALTAAMALIVLSLPWLFGEQHDALGWTALSGAGLVMFGLLALNVERLPLPATLIANRWIAALLTIIADTRRVLATRQGLAALALSITIHLSTVLAVFLIGRGLDLPQGFATYFLVVPTAIVASAIPISLNGWGVREGVMVAALGVYGVAAGDAFLVSMLLGVGVILTAVPGALLWLTVK